MRVLFILTLLGLFILALSPVGVAQSQPDFDTRMENARNQQLAMDQMIQERYSACYENYTPICDTLVWILATGDFGRPRRDLAKTLGMIGCNEGHAEACLAAAYIHASGRTPTGSETAYQSRMEKACAGSDDPICQTFLSRPVREMSPYRTPYDEWRETSDARALFARACDAGSNEGCAVLADLQLNSIGGDLDIAGARASINKACGPLTPPLPDYCDLLAKFEGRTDSQIETDKRAVIFGEQKAFCDDEDSVIACEYVAAALMDGTGTAADMSKAIAYVEKACSLRSANACGWLGRTYYLGTETPKDIALSAEYFQKACDQRDFDACSIVRDIYNDFPNIKPEPEIYKPSAETIKRQAETRALVSGLGLIDPNSPFQDQVITLNEDCDAGDANACYNLAMGYLNGSFDLRADPERAAKMLRPLCDQNRTEACFNLFEAINNGSIKADPAAGEPHALLKKACELGSAFACMQIE